MSKTFLDRKQPREVDQFYADFFLSIALGMVTRPTDLVAVVSEIPVGPNRFAGETYDDPINVWLKRFFVTAQGHVNDHGILIGKRASHVLAFNNLLRCASAKRGEFCALEIEEGVGTKTAQEPTVLDPNWSEQDDEDVAELVWSIAWDCWEGILDTTVRSEGGITTVTIEAGLGIAEEDLLALQTLMKAWGRTNGRSIRIGVLK